MDDSSEKYFDEIIEIFKRLLSALGMWPGNYRSFSELNTMKDKIPVVIRYCIIVGGFITVTLEYLYLGLKARLSDMTDLIDTINTIIVFSLCSLPIYYFTYKGEAIMHIFNTFRQLTKSDDEHLRKIYKREKFFMKYIFLMYISEFVVYILISISAPLLKMMYDKDSPRKLPYKYWYPYDASQTPYYEISYVLESFTGCSMVLVLPACDCMVISIINFLAMHFEHLCIKLELTVDTAKENLCYSEIDDKDRKKLTAEVLRLYKVYIEEQKLLQNLTDLTQDTFEMIIFCYLVLHAAFLGFTAYQAITLMETKEYDLALLNIFFIIGSTVELFLFSFYASKLIHQSTNIYISCFHSAWYETNFNELKTTILTLMLRAQTPCKITALNMIDFSLESFVTIVTSAASYFTLMQSVKDRNG